MLNQVIYTRCMPHRNLLHEGQVERQDGYGVFSMSRDIFNENYNLDFLERRLSVSNGAKEGSPVGLIHSYEYFQLSQDTYAFVYEYAREHGKIPRANGKTHRPGNYIKQCIIGKINGYPCEWFEASIWDAWKKTENDYYLDEPANAEPPFLPMLNENNEKGPVNIQRIKQFIEHGHREEALKAAVAFLIQEFDKPEEERKVLLIKDTPENVALWVAAIGYGFSEELARQITFVTNRSQLGAQMNSVLFYNVDPKGKYVKTSSGNGMKQVPYCMIVGFHPQDPYCKAVHPMQVSRYVLLDGTTNTANFQVEDFVQKKYFQAVARMNQDIEDFGKVFLPVLNVKKISIQIPELYDCYAYLFDGGHKSEQWEYKGCVKYLEMFSRMLNKKSIRFAEYAFNEVLRVYHGFVDFDRKEKFRLLKCIYGLAEYLHNEDEIVGVIEDILDKDIDNLAITVSHLINDYQSLQEAGFSHFCTEALKRKFIDSKLPGYVKNFKNADARTIETVLNIFFDVIENTGLGMKEILNSEEKYTFVIQGIVCMFPDENSVYNVLKKIYISKKLFYRVVISISNKFKDKKDLSQWWNIVSQVNGSGEIGICKELFVAKEGNFELVEWLLSNAIKRVETNKQECCHLLKEAFRVYPAKPDRGIEFFSEWIESNGVADADRIIHEVCNMGVDVYAEQMIFHKLDNYLCNVLLCSEETEMRKAVTNLEKWAKHLNENSMTVTFISFKEQFMAQMTSKNASLLVENMAKKEYTVPDSFFEGRYYKDLVRHATELNEENLHVQMIIMFMQDDYRGIEKSSNKYINLAFKSTKGKEMYSLIACLVSAAVETDKRRINNIDSELIHRVQKSIENELRKIIPQYYKRKMNDQIPINGMSKEALNLLTDILEEAGENNKNGLYNKLFGGLFGRKK